MIIEVGYKKEDVKNLLEQIIENQNPDELEYGLVILYAIEENNEMVVLKLVKNRFIQYIK